MKKWLKLMILPFSITYLSLFFYQWIDSIWRYGRVYFVVREPTPILCLAESVIILLVVVTNIIVLSDTVKDIGGRNENL